MFDNKELVDSLERLRRFAFHLTGNIPDGEDLLQATVLQALEKRHMFETGSNFVGWSSKIMFNLFVSQYRRKTKFESKLDPEGFIERESVAPAQESSMAASEVSDAIDQLSEDQKQIMVMVCVNGHKYEEVASHLNIPVGTVRSRLSRARNNLQTIMARKPLRRRAAISVPVHRVANEARTRASA